MKLSESIPNYPTFQSEENREAKNHYKTFLSIRLEVVRENPVDYIQCRSSQDIVNYFQLETLRYSKEVFKCIHLNSKNIIIGVETISL